MAQYFTSGTVIFLNKKLKAKKCCDYRKVSFIAHTATTVARTRRRRTGRKTEDVLGEDQSGFRSGKGGCNRDAENDIRTSFGQRRETLCVLHRLLEGI